MLPSWGDRDIWTLIKQFEALTAMMGSSRGCAGVSPKGAALAGVAGKSSQRKQLLMGPEKGAGSSHTMGEGGRGQSPER